MNGTIGVNPVGGGSRPLTNFGMGSWGLQEILLDPITYMNMRWEHFPEWWLFRNRI